MQDLVILNESALLKILGNPTFVRRFGIFQTAARQLVELRRKEQGKNCAPCQRKRQVRVLELGRLKQNLAKMTSEDKLELKRMLNTKKVKFYYRRQEPKTKDQPAREVNVRVVF